MSVSERRTLITQLLDSSSVPLSGSALAKKLGVSRQVIVQDIALLRATGSNIIATTNGYIIQQTEKVCRKVYKLRHTEEQVEEELNLMVDYGGSVEDVFIYHKVYGIVRAELNIHTRRDVQEFLKQIDEGESSYLMNATSGYHYHTVTAQSQETLDSIFSELNKKGFLASLRDYEPIDFWNIDQTG